MEGTKEELDNMSKPLRAAHKTIGDAYYKTRWGDAAYE